MKMDHAHTVDTQAVERYLLGELPAAEAEDFERHYFECPECALAVESGHVFIENARQVWKEDEHVPAREQTHERPPKWFTRFLAESWSRPAFALPWAAAVLFGAVALYQGAIVIPGLRSPVEVAEPIPSFQLGGATRGEGSLVAVSVGTPSLSLLADIPSGVNFQKYLCVLTTDGRTVFRVVAPPPKEGMPIEILVSTRALKPGKFELAIYGLEPDGRQSGRISTNPFDFQFN
jgi:hypothetical protein